MQEVGFNHGQVKTCIVSPYLLVTNRFHQFEPSYDDPCGLCRYGVELVCTKQPLLRGRGVSHCKNLLSPRFETCDGIPLNLPLPYHSIAVQTQNVIIATG